MAFLASGIEGIKVRITAKAVDNHAATRLLDAEEREIRAILGSYIFAVDEQTMESVVIDQLRSASLSLATAESLTGGLLGARITEVPGASDVYRVGSWPTPATLSTACSVYPMARWFPKPRPPLWPPVYAGYSMPMSAWQLPEWRALPNRKGQPVGTVYVALALEDHTEVRRLQLGGVRQQIRQFSVIGILNLLRLHLSAASPSSVSSEARRT